MYKLIFLLLFVGISHFTQAQNAESIDLEKSVVTWEGSNVFNFGKHDGTVAFKEGKIIRKDGKIVGGEFVIDMNTIQSNEKGDWTSGLVEHLKNEDFFNVEKYPTAKFVIATVEELGDSYLKITGDLTICGVTKPITYEAKLNDDETQLKGRFKIDRTDWGIVYGSQKVINIKDHAISDAIAFVVELNF